MKLAHALAALLALAAPVAAQITPTPPPLRTVGILQSTQTWTGLNTFTSVVTFSSAQILSPSGMTVVGTMTVQGNAFSVGGSTINANAGTVKLASTTVTGTFHGLGASGFPAGLTASSVTASSLTGPTAAGVGVVGPLTAGSSVTVAGSVGVGTSSPLSKLHVSGGAVLVSSGGIHSEGNAALPLNIGSRIADGTFSTFTLTSDGVAFINVGNSATALPTIPGLWVRDLNGTATPVIGFHQATTFRRGMRNPAGNRDLDLFTENSDADGNINLYTGNNVLAASFRAASHFVAIGSVTALGGAHVQGNLGVGTAAPTAKLNVAGGNVLVSSGALRTEGAVARPLELGARMSDGTFSTFTVTSDGVMFLNVLNSASALPTVPGLWVRDLNGVATPVIGFHQADTFRRGLRNPGGNRDVDIFTQNSDGDGNVNVYTGNNTLTASFRDTGGFRLYSRTIAQLNAITPDAVGEAFYCNNCSPAKIVVSTGTSAGNFADAIGGAFQ